MTIQFDDYRRPSNSELVIKVISEIEENISLLVFISRVFDLHRENTPELLPEINSDIVRIINSKRLNVSDQKRRDIIDLLKEIYRKSNFSKIRSSILEAIVYKFGPIRCSNKKVRKYVEPRILHKDRVVGGNNRRIDNVFFISESEPIEFVECKANIASFIPCNYELHEMPNHNYREKIEYLADPHNYLRRNFCKPYVFIACYNNNYKRQLENVHKNWGLSFIEFVSTGELSGLLQHKLK